MTATPARHFGPYEFIAPLGAGGMGEVFRARDTRLGRDVAIKVLPVAFSADPERLRRFEQEACAAAALNHPALMAIYDIGTENGAPYIVSELLEGATLRHCLRDGRMPLRKAIEYAAQMAHGLAAAHEKGIVHRDLKPENIFITRDGRAKILDFGLAKLVERNAPSSHGESMTREDTAPGLVLGTVGYMSPEQVRGQAVDHRSDIFSFGAILYEMLSGQRAFKGDTAAETMTAILREDPPDLTTTTTATGAHASIPPALDQIVRHCLQKEPQQRFQSASDMAFNLEALSSASSSGISALRALSASTSPIPGMSRRMFFATVGMLVAIAIAIGAFSLGQHLTTRPAPLAQYKQITYQQGAILSARFSPDGQTIFCAARFDKKTELYSGRLDSIGMRPMGVKAFQILSVSAAGGIAFLDPTGLILNSEASVATLASVPLGGGAPRPILKNVRSADWARDGSGLAVARYIPEKLVDRLEYPIGKTLYETAGYISGVHFSPDGKTLAFLDHPIAGDDQGFVAVIPTAGGTVRRLTPLWFSVRAAAWRPDGGEVWFTAAQSGTYSLFAVTLGRSPKLRQLQTGFDSMEIEDVASNGKALVNHRSVRSLAMVSTSARPVEQDFASLDLPEFFRFSSDGKQILVGDDSEVGGANYSTFLRNVDGSQPVRLGDGSGLALSPDGEWAISQLPQAPNQLLLLPTGPGEARQLTHSAMAHEAADWFPDGKRIVFTSGGRTYLLDLNGKETALTPEGATGTLVTPDGQYVVVSTKEGKYELYPVAGGKPKPIEWLHANDFPRRFSGDGKALLVATAEEGKPGRDLYRIQFADGRRTLLRHIQPPQDAISSRIGNVDVTPDGTGYAYGYAQWRTALYVVSGLR
ncbi:MAG: protein kinase [Acidobacteriaceae bacterium]